MQKDRDDNVCPRCKDYNKDLFLTNRVNICSGCALYYDNELKPFINCDHLYVKAQGIGGGYIFLYCNKCGATKHEG